MPPWRYLRTMCTICNLDGTGDIFFAIAPKEADYIIHPLTESFFCYDEGPNGSPMVDGYHWEIEFYNAKGLVRKAEGWPGEPKWRHKAVRDMCKFIERWTGKDLGSLRMQEQQEENEADSLDNSAQRSLSRI